MKALSKLYILLAVSASVRCYCPPENIQNTGFCTYRIHCFGDISAFGLPEQCQGSTNYDVAIDLTLDAAHDFENYQNDTELLMLVTTFRAIANWPETNLTILESMPRLKRLFLNNNHIQRIHNLPFYNLNYIEIIDLSQNRLNDVDIFQFKAAPNTLKALSLAYNAIENVPYDAFEELTSLIELDLSNNYITSLKEPFHNLNSLEILRLNDNQIKDLNGALYNLTNLRHLYLRNNHIKSIDEQSLNIIHHLETFDISENQMDLLKPIIFLRHWKHFGGYCKIILSDNFITLVPNGTSKEVSDRFTRDLTVNKINVETKVDLSKNIISNVEYNAFQSIGQLIWLDVSQNKLIDFNINAEHLKNLQYLNLSTNFITNLNRDTFVLMSNLQNLDLSYNQLNNIGDEAFMRTFKLKYVNMTFNKIDKTENLAVTFHPDGGILDLSNNGLFKLSIPHGESSNLAILILHSNYIHDASLINVLYQTKLNTVDLSTNDISALNESSLLLPITVTTLNLTNNSIEQIGPSTFHRVCRLKTLFLGHNKLENIEYGAFQSLITLSNLDLSFNEIKYLDSSILSDLKSLRVLSLRCNGLYSIDYKAWLGHNFVLRVYLDGNSFSCEWLGMALSDYNNGYSKMHPTVLDVRSSVNTNSIEGIPCVQKDKTIGEIRVSPNYELADERLLMTNQKILLAVKEQTFYLRYFINQFKANDTNLYNFFKMIKK